MFIPNLVGSIRSAIGHDIHGRPQFGEVRVCPFAAVWFNRASQKTNVRADSSASRGAADETVMPRAKILVPITVPVGIDDHFEYKNVSYTVVGVHERYSTMGSLDHIEVSLEPLP